MNQKSVLNLNNLAVSLRVYIALKDTANIINDEILQKQRRYKKYFTFSIIIFKYKK